MSQFFQILSAKRTIDDAMIAAHRERHAMADDDLVAIIDYRNFRNPANSENETLWRIYYSGETVDSHAAEI